MKTTDPELRYHEPAWVTRLYTIAFWVVVLVAWGLLVYVTVWICGGVCATP
jgi:hypothetical protein